MDPFFLVQNIYSSLATSNGETTSFCAYAMTATVHHSAVRKLERLFALGSAQPLELSQQAVQVCVAASPCCDECVNFRNVVLTLWPLC